MCIKCCNRFVPKVLIVIIPKVKRKTADRYGINVLYTQIGDIFEKKSFHFIGQHVAFTNHILCFFLLFLRYQILCFRCYHGQVIP